MYRCHFTNKDKYSVNRLIPQRLYISITNRCNADCDFCSFRDINTPSYKKHLYFALTMGSVLETNYEEIVKTHWQKNEFLKALFEGNIQKIYWDFFKKDKLYHDYQNFFSCHTCYKLRSDEEFISFLRVRDSYVTSELTVAQWKAVIEGALRAGINKIVFADEGEPIMEIDKLCCLLEFSKRKFNSLVVFTNGYFAHDEYSAYSVLERLKRSGLTQLGISCDQHVKYRFHQFFIPMERIVNLVKVAERLKIEIFFSSVFVNYEDTVSLKDYLEELANKKFILHHSEWDNIKGIKGTIRYILNTLNNRNGVFKKDTFFLNKVRANPRVDNRILEKDLFSKKDMQYKNLGWMRKFIFQRIRPCFKNQIILSNGLVICCAMNTY